VWRNLARLSSTGALKWSFELYLLCDELSYMLNWYYSRNSILKVLSSLRQLMTNAPSPLDPSLKTALNALDEINAKTVKYDDKEFRYELIPILDLVRSHNKKAIVSFTSGAPKAEARLQAQVAVLARLAAADGPIETPDYEAATYLLAQGSDLKNDLEPIRGHWKRSYDRLNRESKRKIPVLVLGKHGKTRTKWVKDPVPRSKIFWEIPDFRDVEYHIAWIRLRERARFPGFEDVVSEIRNGFRDGILAEGGTTLSDLRRLSVDLWQIVRTSRLSRDIDSALASFLDRITQLQSPEGYWRISLLSRSGRRTEKRDVLATAAFSFMMLVTGHNVDHAHVASEWLLTQQHDHHWSDKFGWNVLATCLASLAIHLSGSDPGGYLLNDACSWLLKQQHKTGEWMDKQGASSSIITVLVLDVLNLILYHKTPTFAMKRGENDKTSRYLPDIMGSIDKSNQLTSSIVGFKLFKDVDPPLVASLGAGLQHPCQNQQELSQLITDLNKLLIEGLDKSAITQKYPCVELQTTLDSILYLLQTQFGAKQDSCDKIGRAYRVLRDLRTWAQHRVDSKTRQKVQKAFDEIGAEYPSAADATSQWSSLWRKVLDFVKRNFVFTIREVIEISKKAET
jgi:hypothetical protein